MVGGISSPSWQCITLIVLAFRGVICYLYHLLREPKTTIECIHDSFGKENPARQEKGSVIIPFKSSIQVWYDIWKINTNHYRLLGKLNTWRFSVSKNYSRLKRKSAFREFEDTVEGSEMARKPPGIHPKPVVNTGIFTYIYHINRWVSLPDFWLPSTVSAL